MSYVMDILASEKKKKLCGKMSHYDKIKNIVDNFLFEFNENNNTNFDKIRDKIDLLIDEDDNDEYDESTDFYYPLSNLEFDNNSNNNSNNNSDNNINVLNELCAKILIKYSTNENKEDKINEINKIKNIDKINKNITYRQDKPLGKIEI
jgi:hypothetical protein